MNFIERLFGKKKPNPPSKKSSTLIKEIPNMKTIEEVRNIGLNNDSFHCVLLERKYMFEHPCNCGGTWERVGGGSAFPRFVYSDCKCPNCGAEKQFVFYF
jgi:hypothetical protein